MRIIAAFSQQLGGHVRIKADSLGTEFIVTISIADERETRNQERAGQI